MIINSDLKNKYFIKEKTSFKSSENTTSSSSVPNYIPVYEKNDFSAKLIDSLRFHLNNNQNIKGYKLLQTFSIPYIKEGKVFQLDNGHKVVIIPKSGLTTIGTYVKTGFINEPIKGISHLLEHVIGNGGKLKDLSDKSYNSNASTSYQTTLYYQNVALQGNNEVNEYISGISSALLKPDFNQQVIDREKEIILSESKTIKDKNNQPSVNILIENLFGVKTDKNSHIGVGSDENVKKFSKQDLINYYNAYYTPDNMVSVVVGDVKYDDVMNSFSRNFRQEPNTLNSVSRIPLQITPLQQTKRFDIINPSINKPSVILGFVGPKNNDLKGIIVLDLIGQILLNKDNIGVLKKLKNYEQLSFFQNSINCNPMINNFIGISSEVNNNPQKSLQSMYNLISELSQKQITQEELQLIKEKMKNEMLKDNEGSLKIFQNIGLNYLSLNKIITSSESFKIIDSLTLQDIQNYTKQFLDLNKTCIVVEHPSKEKNISFKGKIPQINMENVKEYSLANNLKLVIDSSETNTSSVVSFSINNKNVLPPKPGVDEILYVMLSIGNKKHNASQLTQIREKNLFNRAITSYKGSIDATIECPADKTVKILRLKIFKKP